MAPHPTNAPKVRAITDAEVATFHRDGVAHLPQLISPDQVPTLLAAADRWRADPNTQKENLSADGRFVDGLGIWPTEPALSKYTFESGLAGEVGRAMGSTAVRFYFDHLFMLETNTAKDSYYWHQDLPYWSIDGRQICSVWLALTPCDTTSGALEFVLGSGDGPLFTPTAFGTEEASRYEAATEVVPIPEYHAHRDAFDIVSFPIQAGDALLFTPRIVHSSRGNHSLTNRRVAYSTRWIGDDVVYYPREAATDDILTPHGPLAPGDSLTTDQFPLVWSSSERIGS